MISHNWQNKDNWQFYDDFPRGALSKQYEQRAGLAGAPELDLVQEYWKSASSILELGAGEGRVIEGILHRNYQGQICTLERHPLFLEQLHERYQNNSQVTIVKGELLQPEKLPQAKVGLWLWAGILEFSPKEQQKVLQNLEQHIEQTLILETPALGSTTNATRGKEHWLEIQGASGRILHGYLPSKEEVCSYTIGTQWRLNKTIPYEILKDRKRMLYVLQKKETQT